MAGPKLSQEELFGLLVSQLTTSAWVQLGKIPDPVSGKVQRNLEAASLTIDILDMLAVKTRGNLSTDERQVLDGNLSQLKLNYVEELKKGESSGEKAEATSSSSGDDSQGKASSDGSKA